MKNKYYSELVAIFTTYKPDNNFYKRIKDVINCCGLVIIVDNTPGGHDFKVLNNVTILQDGLNKGLGKALNVGIKAAIDRGFSMAILFDQDSSPDDEFIGLLVDNLNDLSCSTKTCVGPLMLDDDVFQNGSNSLLQSDIHKMAPRSEVSCLATSGMLFWLDGLRNDSNFSESLFLDFVDFDWCWRLRRDGWMFYRINSVPMLHRLGLAQKKWMGITYHIPAPYRHYFQFRDTLKLLTYSYVPTYSKFRLGLILFPKIVIYPFIMDSGYQRFKWMLLGIFDAIKGVSGVGSASEILE